MADSVPPWRKRAESNQAGREDVLARSPPPLGTARWVHFQKSAKTVQNCTAYFLCGSLALGAATSQRLYVYTATDKMLPGENKQKPRKHTNKNQENTHIPKKTKKKGKKREKTFRSLVAAQPPIIPHAPGHHRGVRGWADRDRRTAAPMSHIPESPRRVGYRQEISDNRGKRTRAAQPRQVRERRKTHYSAVRDTVWLCMGRIGTVWDVMELYGMVWYGVV